MVLRQEDQRCFGRKTRVKPECLRLYSFGAVSNGLYSTVSSPEKKHAHTARQRYAELFINMAAERKIKLGRRTRQNNPVRSQRKKPESLSASVCLGAKLCLLETSATGTRWRFGSFGNHLYFSLAFQMSMCQRYQRCRRRCFVGAVPI